VPKTTKTLPDPLDASGGDFCNIYLDQISFFPYNKPMKSNYYIVIMAGGSGTRLWPMSRKDSPKQFHKFTSQRSLLQETYDRVKDIVPRENIYVSLVENVLKTTKVQLQKIPKDNFIIEPEAKNTAPAIGLVTTVIFKKDPEAVITTIASDHTLDNKTNFQNSLKKAYEFVKKSPEYFVVKGIQPTRPDTGFGYIQMGKKIQQDIFAVEKFIEKPDLETAKKYLKKGNYLWNGCYFTFKASEMLKNYQKFSPEIYNGLREILRGKKVKEVYKKFSVVPIETAIAEKIEKIAVIPMDLGHWSDVGTWASLYEILSSKEEQVISKGNHIGVDDKNCLVYAGDRLLATVGLEDIIIVDTPDVTLVCNKNKSQDVKKLIKKLKEQGNNKYL